MSTTPDFRKALAIKNPWAFLIIRPDLSTADPLRKVWEASELRKNIENRSRPFAYRGELWIHAGLSYDHEAFATIVDAFPSLKIPLMLNRPGGAFDQRGGLIGKVRLTGCVKHHPSIWFGGPNGLILEQPEPCTFEPVRGMLGIFTVGDVPLHENATVIDHSNGASPTCGACLGTGKRGNLGMPCNHCFPFQDRDLLTKPRIPATSNDRPAPTP